MSRSSGSVSSLPRLLDTVVYPIDRERLLVRATEIDAPKSILEAIQRLRPGKYHSRIELIYAIVSLVPDPKPRKAD